MGSARHVAIISMLSLSLIVSVRQTAVAQQLKSQEEALRIINDFADRFCPKIPLAGSSSAVDLSGSVKAELPGLLKKIADLGFKAAARYQQSQYQGVLQKDLLAAMRDSTDCKLTVLESLIDVCVSNRHLVSRAILSGHATTGKPRGAGATAPARD